MPFGNRRRASSRASSTDKICDVTSRIVGLGRSPRDQHLDAHREHHGAVVSVALTRQVHEALVVTARDVLERGDRHASVDLLAGADGSAHLDVDVLSRRHRHVEQEVGREQLREGRERVDAAGDDAAEERRLGRLLVDVPQMWIPPFRELDDLVLGENVGAELAHLADPQVVEEDAPAGQR